MGTIELRMPNINGTEREQLVQIRSYLYQIIPQLQWALNNVNAAELSSGAVQQIARQISSTAVSGSGGTSVSAEVSFERMKELIIESSEIVEAYYEKINKELKGIYLAKSDFGMFANETNQKIEKTSTYTDQKFSNVQLIITDEIDGVKASVGEDMSNLNTFFSNALGVTNQRITEEVAALNSSIAETNKEIKGVNNLLTEANGKINGLTEAINDTNDNIDILIEAKNLNAEDVKKLNTELSKINGSIDEISTNIENVDGQIVDINGSVANVEELTAGLNESVGNVEKSIGETNAKIDDTSGAVENLKATAEETSKKVTDLDSAIGAAKEEISSLGAAISKTTAYIRTGLLDDTVVPPVYGVEVGQTNTVNGVEKFNQYARFTANRLSFYDQNGNEAAYISDYKLYIKNAEITSSFKIGGFIDTVMSNGDVVTRWVGGEG